MATTARGLEITGADPDAVEAVDTFTARLARISSGVEDIVAAADAHPGTASVQLGAAMLFLYAQTSEMSGRAATYLQRVDALRPALNERELATFAALERWHAGDLLAGIEIFEAALERWPRDLLALKALEFLYYLTGQQYNGARFLACVEALAPANPDDADVLAVWAFAAELAGDPDRAIDLADQAIAVAPHNPWAHHATAHALITMGNPPSALDRLTGYLPVWETSGRVIHGHNTWHLAVAHLDRLDVDAARRIYRDHVWGFSPDSPVEQIDAASLLWRIEMAGWTVDGDEIAQIAEHVEARTAECYHPFLSAHHAWVLARAGRRDALAALFATVQRRTEADDAEARRVWQPVGRSVVDACAAHGVGDLDRCATLLDPVMEGFTAIGGSDAQNDLFRQAYLTALVGSGRHADAHSQFTRMTAWKTPSPLDERFGATVEAGHA